ncbi:MAG: hypothetical protein ACPG19_08175 [Saprospiraceae bacterium]
MSDKIIKCVIITLSISAWSLQTYASSQMTKLIFYTEDISIQFENSILLEQEAKANETSIHNFYEKLEKLPFRPLLLQLTRYKKKLNLNSYLYSELVQETVRNIYGDRNSNYRTLIHWYILAKSGYDARLTHAGPSIYLYAYTRDEIYSVQIIKLGNKEFVNLSDLKDSDKNIKSNSYYIVEFVPNAHGKPISFRLNKLPNFQSRPLKRKLVFAHRNQLYRFDITMDENLIDLMRSYPLINPDYYIETPLSNALKKSLVPKLKQLVEKKGTIEAVQFLLSLTRTAFDYKTDKDNFGKNKPMIPDEVLFYSASDCEDRSALFYTLVKELLDVPLIVVDYPEHLTIGVALPENIGKPLYYEGRQYTICDPTGPSDSDAMGIYPKGYEELPYKVALSFK